MSKTRNLSDLLDANGDVKSGALDNVPASDNASALTSGTLPDARLSSNVTQNGSTQTLTNKTINASNNTLSNIPNSALSNSAITINGSATSLGGSATISTDLSNDSTPQLGGDLASNGNDILMADSDKIKLGTGNDLEIYHDGNDSYMKNDTGGLFLLGNNAVQIKDESNSKFIAKFVEDGACELYHNNVKKFETTSAGGTLTGTLTATAFSGDGSALTNLSGGVSDVEIVVVTSSGTYTPTSGTKFVTVYCIGGGGGGGNTSGGNNEASVGGGGGAGGMAIRTYNATELGANASVSIGSGGSGGASHYDPRDGSNGNGTTFDPAGTGTTLIGYGGTGGYGSTNQYWGRGGVGGSASNGQINQNGMPAYVISNHSAGSSYSRSSQGNTAGVTGMMGGDSMFTRGSTNTAYGSSGNVEVSGASGAIGCGGQGAMARQNYQAGGSGGSGGSGYVVIMEYA